VRPIAIVVGLVIAGCSAGCSGSPEVDAGQVERAADFHSPRVEATIESASRVVRTRGFASDGAEQRGFLVDQATEVRSIPMRTGSCWVILAAGSSALRELDLLVFDADGAEVARDGEQGAMAVVRFCPAQNGTYYASLRAAAGSGLYALRTFRGPTGLAFRVDDVVRAVGPTPAAAE